MIDELKKRFGNKCSSIKINGGAMTSGNIPDFPVTFCQALNYSFNVPIQINSKNIGCPGARRSIGFDKDDEKLVKTISSNNTIPESFVDDAISNISTLNLNVRHINLGMTSEMEEASPPDLYIMYVRPAKITEIMHLYAQYKIQPSIPTYSLLSICGNVFANSFDNQLISISFGCPESRKNGGVNDNEVIVAVPYKYAKFLTA